MLEQPVHDILTSCKPDFRFDYGDRMGLDQIIEAIGTLDKHLVAEGDFQIMWLMIADVYINPDFIVLENSEAGIPALADPKLKNCIDRSS